ncbi:MAG: hypothetical protein Q9190_000425 [Brigantiaea leucoxantha]
MPLTSVSELEKYLQDHVISFKSLTLLTGGNANYCFRLSNPPFPNTILKHAEPYAAAISHLPLPSERMDYEASAMKILKGLLCESESKGETVQLPEVVGYDAQAKVLQMSDGGSTTLKAFYQQCGKGSEKLIKNMGRALGGWLADLHVRARKTDIGEGGNPIARALYRYSYERLIDSAKEWGQDEDLARKVDERYGVLLQSDDEGVCHGDFWPGNILVADREEDCGRKLTVVDWEMCRRGSSATDVGQFAAEAWLLDRFHGGKGLLESFLRAYRERRVEVDGQLDANWLQRASVQCAVHLGYWPSWVQWGNEKETREVIATGFEMLKRADREDWIGLSEGILQELWQDSK